MRIILSCLVLTFLTACQTTGMIPIDVTPAANLPSDKWTKTTIGGPAHNVTYFSCPEEKCGEKLGIMISQRTMMNTGNLTTEEMLRMRSVNDAFLKEGFGLSMAKSNINSTKTVDMKTVRKINGDPVGLYLDGTMENENDAFSFASETRVRRNRVVIAVAYAKSSKVAQNTLKLVRPAALLK
jgi:hypothetical protein